MVRDMTAPMDDDGTSSDALRTTFEGDVLPAAAPDQPEDPHELLSTPSEYGVNYYCACGQWDGWARATGSTRFVQSQHAEHRHNVAEQQAADDRARAQLEQERTDTP